MNNKPYLYIRKRKIAIKADGKSKYIRFSSYFICRWKILPCITDTKLLVIYWLTLKKCMHSTHININKIKLREYFIAYHVLEYIYSFVTFIFNWTCTERRYDIYLAYGTSLTYVLIYKRTCRRQDGGNMLAPPSPLSSSSYFSPTINLFKWTNTKKKRRNRVTKIFFFLHILNITYEYTT